MHIMTRKQELCTELKQIRIASQVPQAAIASDLGIDKQTVWNIENKGAVSFTRFIEIAALFGYDVVLQKKGGVK